MNSNTQLIYERMQEIARQPHTMFVAQMVAGSYVASNNTISVRIQGWDMPVEGVRLGVLSVEQLPMLWVPEDDSMLIVCTIYGMGEWYVLQAAKVRKVVLTIGDAELAVDILGISMKKGHTLLQLSAAACTLKTERESLYQILYDLLQAITSITVATAAGTSGIPTNVADFLRIQGRLGLLLEH